MASYLTPQQFSDRSVMPAEHLETIEALSPGWLATQLEQQSAWLDARLRKRYSAPFASPYPAAVLGWLTDIVTLAAYLRRGVNAQDEQFQLIKEAAQNARAEVREAADSQTGLFDLPLASGESAISKGGPFGYSEQSPYVGFDVQRDAATLEDQSRRGTGG